MCNQYMQTNAVKTRDLTKEELRSKAPLYVHIGLPKTATTLLQRNLFRKHSEVFFLGKLGSEMNSKSPQKRGVCAYASPGVSASVQS